MMCRIFAHQDPSNYAFETRSLRIGGHGTSVRLESLFWTILEEIAESQGMSLGKLLTKLSEEVLELHGNVHNFASLLRCSCLIYLQARPRSGMPSDSLPLAKVAPAA
jgi:predicted DNA-binding ribbon-helix-helix protein